MSVCPHLETSHSLDIFTAGFLFSSPSRLPPPPCVVTPTLSCFAYTSTVLRFPAETSLPSHQLPVPSHVCGLGLVFTSLEIVNVTYEARICSFSVHIQWILFLRRKLIGQTELKLLYFIQKAINTQWLKDVFNSRHQVRVKAGAWVVPWS